jgi:PAS domain S-box-containing protein
MKDRKKTEEGRPRIQARPNASGIRLKEDRAEEILRESETRYRIIADNTYDWEWWVSPEGKFLYVSPSCERITGYPPERFLQDPLFIESIIHADDRDLFRNHLRHFEKQGAPAEIEFRVVRPDGTIRWVAHACQPVFDTEGRPLGRRGSNRETTERKQTEDRLHTTNVLLSLFSRTSKRKDYLDSVVGLIQQWSKCRCVGIRVLDPQGHIPYESYVGFSRQFWETENYLSIHRDQCACIRVVTGELEPHDASMRTPAGSFRCNDTAEFIGNLTEKERARYRGLCIQMGFLSLAIVPIRYRGQSLGGLHLADEQKGRVSLETIEFIESMAPLIGEAIHRFNLEDELRISESRLRHLSSQLLTVQENERKRVARELHDGIGQMLTAVKFKMESSLHDSANPGKDSIRQSLETVIPMVHESIQEVRRIQMALRPSILDDLGILATLGWFCREFQKVYPGITIEKNLDLEETAIPDSLKTPIYRIIQEALNNVAKHSQADRVHLTLTRKDDKIELTVEDNGMGFDGGEVFARERSHRGFGLSGMRERTELSGGVFLIESSKGKGTTLRGSWPATGIPPA